MLGFSQLFKQGQRLAAASLLCLIACAPSLATAVGQQDESAAKPAVEQAPNSKPARSNDELADASEPMRQEVAPGVVVYGRANRFAEIGNSQTFDYSPDGRTLVFASSKIKFFDLIENKVIGEVGEPGEYYQTVAYSPDGRYVFGFTRSGGKPAVRVVDAITHESVGSILTETGEEKSNQYFNLQKLIVSADAKYIGFIGYNTLQVRDVASGDLVMNVGEIGYVQDAAFSLDETKLIVPQGGKLTVYDLETGETLKRTDSKLVGQSGRFMAVNYGGSLLAITQSGSVLLFDLKEDKKAGVIRLPSGAYPQQLSFSDDGAMLAAVSYVTNPKGGGRYKVVIADVQTRKTLKSVSVPSQGISKVAFATDGNSLIVAGQGIAGALEVRLDEDQPADMAKYPAGPSKACALHSSGESFISCTKSGEVSWFDERSGELIRTIQKLNVNSIEFSNDDSEVMLTASWGDEDPVTTLSYESGEQVRSYGFKAAKKKSRVFSAIRSFLVQGGPELTVHNQTRPLSVKNSLDGAHINAISWEMTFRIVVVGIGVEPEQSQEVTLRFMKLDSETGERIATKSFSPKQFGFGKNEWIQIASIHPEGEQLIIAKGDKIYVADCESGDIIDEFNTGSRLVSIDYSPDGKYFYGTHQKGVTVWDSESQVEVFNLEKRIGNPKIAFSKSCTRMVVCPQHSKSSVEIYDTKSWKVVKSRDQTQANRTSVALSGDGQKLLIGLADCRLELWDLALIN